MKMTWAIFFGALVMLGGLSILLKAFGVNLPLVQTAFGFFLIFLGVRMLIGAWTPLRVHTGASASAVMTNSVYRPESYAAPMKYDVVFGKGVVDLTHLPQPEHDVFIEVNAIFSGVDVLVDPSLPWQLDGSSAFGAVKTPDRQVAAFGEVHSAGKEVNGPRLRIKAAAVFGSCEIHESTPPPRIVKPTELPAT